MRDYLNIGASPSGEKCVQVGDPDYYAKATAECKRFLTLIRKHLGEEVGTASLKIKQFQHESGPYMEVVCYFDDEDEIGMKYAFRCESESPEYWA